MNAPTNERPGAQHRVTWSGGVAHFHCDGDQASACHFFPDCECEYWTAEHDARHPRVEHDDECWILPWLENIESEFTWADADGVGVNLPPMRDAAICTQWDGDQIIWEYDDSVAAGVSG